jgi:hypothetical protein
MSDEEFLKRWSRRKQEAKVVSDAPQPAPAAAETTETKGELTSDQPEAVPESEVDLSKLPPIDSITATTDITEFLRKGVPGELSRAALRRAWTADPAIRDFVGLAENAWDFNDPNAIPGFGPLDYSADQVKALVERIVGGVRESADTLADAIAEHEPLTTTEGAESSLPTQAIADSAREGDAGNRDGGTSAAATQPEPCEADESEAPPRRRTHGGALPE